MPKEDHRQEKAHGPVRDARPVSQGLLANIIKHVTARAQHGENKAERDACNALALMPPAFRNMRDEHAPDAQQ